MGVFSCLCSRLKEIDFYTSKENQSLQPVVVGVFVVATDGCYFNTFGNTTIKEAQFCMIHCLQISLSFQRRGEEFHISFFGINRKHKITKYNKMLKYSLIVAVCENFGIGIKGDLPWRLKSELKYFSNTTKRVKDTKKRNVVIMGRKTYFGIPESKRPLPQRLNIVLSTTLRPTDLPSNVLLHPNLESAMQFLEENELLKEIETVWIVGGSGVYAEAMVSPRCHRLYLTKIYGKFECDTFFPKIPDEFKEAELDEETPRGIQEENNIKYEYKIWEKQAA